jgi:probable rRNA maturation factor
MAIQFFNEDIENVILSKNKIRVLLKMCIAKHEKKIGNINFIFCSDEYLKNINYQYLKHDYYTDIITFNYNKKVTLNSDIYISIERVNDNAKNFKVEFINELHRVMIHGILHLIGFNDESAEEKMKMRQTEDECLALYL